jgi:heat shock protein HslJ
MTIEQRLAAAGERFRAEHAEPVGVDIADLVSTRELDDRDDLELSDPTFDDPTLVETLTLVEDDEPPARRRGRWAVPVAAAMILLALVGGIIGVRTWDEGKKSEPTAAVGNPAGLHDTSWSLLSATDNGIAVTVKRGLALTFAADGSATADDNCNFYSFDYTATGTTLKPTNVTGTAVGCTGPNYVAKVFFSDPSKPVGWQLTGDRLNLSANGVTLTYVDSESYLFPSDWRLREVVNAAPDSNFTDGPTLHFASGTVTGADRCGGFVAKVGYSATTLTITDWRQTSHSCSLQYTQQDSAANTEDRVLKPALGGSKTIGWRVVEGQLQLTSGKIQLVYAAS